MNNPTIIFIDDSATMREVIKIAFRRENMDVVSFSDAGTALIQMEQNTPDVVITDVIMPDKDGYEVCQFIKQHPTLNRTPVILMSGVVNRAVAERAFSVKADELIRKPFQPHDLITRVKHLLVPAKATATAQPAASAAAALSSIFSASPAPSHPGHAAKPIAVGLQPSSSSVQSQALAGEMRPPAPEQRPLPMHPAASANGDLQKLRLEIMRLEGLLRKVQSELQAERDYAKSLEEQLKICQQP